MSQTKSREELKEDISEVGRRLYRNVYIDAGDGNVSIRQTENELKGTKA